MEQTPDRRTRTDLELLDLPESLSLLREQLGLADLSDQFPGPMPVLTELFALVLVTGVSPRLSKFTRAFLDVAR